jgi:UDP-2,3-diacylglucosamine hydrolase
MLIGHGDGLGPEDKGYKRMKKVFTFPFFKWLFRWLHPDIGVKLGQYMSVKNKLISGDEDAKFLGEEDEWLVQYCKRKLASKHYDYFVFGHRHLPLEIKLQENSTYVNLGDWIQYFTYGVFNENELYLKKY